MIPFTRAGLEGLRASHSRDAPCICSICLDWIAAEETCIEQQTSIKSYYAHILCYYATVKCSHDVTIWPIGMRTTEFITSEAFKVDLREITELLYKLDNT